MKSQHAPTNFKGYFVVQTPVLNALKIFDTQILIRLRFGMANSINTHLKPKIRPLTEGNFKP